MGAAVMPEKPSDSFFGGLLKSLYPAGAYEGVLPPEVIDEERRMALRRGGLALMERGSAWRPNGAPQAPGLSAALDPDQWSNRLASVAQNAQQVQSMQRKAQQAELAHSILARFGAQPGETEVQRDARLGHLADAFQSAGLMEEAKQAADLRTSLRSPELGVHGNYFYDKRTGNIVGQFPAELQTVDGAQLYSTAVQRINKWDPIQGAIAQYNQFRNSDVTTNAASAQALQKAVQTLIDTSRPVVGGGEGSIGHIPVIGEVAKMLAGIFGHSGPMTETERKNLISAADNMINNVLATRHKSEMDDIRRIYRERFGADAVNGFMSVLPQSPEFNAQGPVAAQGSDIDEMNRSLGRGRKP